MRRCRDQWLRLKEQDFEWWAKIITTTYLSVFLGTVIARFSELISLPLNELGDFAAGMFGPLAFLWLVLGYHQQGKELKISSDALLAQVEEMKVNSRLQTEAAARQERLADPELEIVYRGLVGTKPEKHDSFDIRNVGESCRLIKVLCFPAVGEPRHQGWVPVEDLSRGSSVKFVLSEPLKTAALLVVRYTRKTGMEGEIFFNFIKFLDGHAVLQPIDNPFPNGTPEQG